MESLAAGLTKAPFYLQIPKMVGGVTIYKYAFEAKQVNSLIADCTVTITNIESKREVTNGFKILMHSTRQGVLVCTHLGPTRLMTPITIPVEFQKTKKYVISGSFAEIRAMFSLNRFEEGFGWLATMFCSSMTVEIDEDLSLICRGLGGYVLNRSEPNHAHFEDEELPEFKELVKTTVPAPAPEASSFLDPRKKSA